MLLGCYSYNEKISKNCLQPKISFSHDKINNKQYHFQNLNPCQKVIATISFSYTCYDLCNTLYALDKHLFHKYHVGDKLTNLVSTIHEPPDYCPVTVIHYYMTLILCYSTLMCVTLKVMIRYHLIKVKDQMDCRVLHYLYVGINYNSYCLTRQKSISFPWQEYKTLKLKF